MYTSLKLRKLIAYILCCSLFVVGIITPTSREVRASHNPPPPSFLPNVTPAASEAPEKETMPQVKAVDDETRVRVTEVYNKLPLSFEENRGQVDKEVGYISRGHGYMLYLTPTEAVLALRRADAGTRKGKRRWRPQRRPQSATRAPRSDVLRMKLKGASRSPAVTGEHVTGTQVNYFKGNDPKKWQTNVARYERVRYAQVYPGIDVVYYGQQQQLEYDFEVAPGVDAGLIALEFEGVRRVSIERRTGELVLKTAGGEVRQRRPVTYQEVGGERREIVSRYVLRGGREVGIEVGEYDRTKPLVIDPVLTYSTYLGGTADDYGFGIAADAAGNAYVVGSTVSDDFPTFRQYQKARGAPWVFGDAFVAKINTNAAGRASLVYSTYLGGATKCCTGGSAIAVDSSGIIYVTGGTVSPDFPTLNPYQQTFRGDGALVGDAFLAKLNPNLSGAASLVYSTYLGGSLDDFATGVAVDSAGHAYLTGYTHSPDFPTLHRYKAKRGGQDAFVTKLDTNASGAAQLVYSTYLGGSRDDFSRGIAADSSGTAYVTGYTYSPDFPTLRAYQTTAVEPHDQYQHAAFVTRLDTNQAGAASLRYSTYLSSPLGFLTGGTSSAYAIAADSSGNVYVTGEADSQSFPLLNQYQVECVGAFVTRLDTNQAGAASLTYSTYLCDRGGVYGGVSVGLGIALDPSGNVYVTGWTNTPDFPRLNPAQKYRGDNSVHAFVAKLNPNLAGKASLIYSTTLGGNSSEEGRAIAVDSSGNAYVTGHTFSSDFPKVNQYPSYHPALNGFVTKLRDSYTVRGRVTKDGLTGLGAVTVTLTGSKHDTFVTNSNGEYFFAQLITGGDYTVTPSKGDLTFTPSRRRFTDLAADQPDVDFRTRSASVTGRVTIGTAGGEGLGGVTMRLTGGTNFAPREVKSSSTGAYTFGQVPTPGSYKVTPSKVGYRFGPERAALINLTTSRTGVDFTASPATGGGVK